MMQSSESSEFSEDHIFKRWLRGHTYAITMTDNENSTGNEMRKKKQVPNACYSNMVTSNWHNITECEIANACMYAIEHAYILSGTRISPYSLACSVVFGCPLACSLTRSIRWFVHSFVRPFGEFIGWSFVRSFVRLLVPLLACLLYSNIWYAAVAWVSHIMQTYI